MKLTILCSQAILVTGIAIAVSGWSNSALALQPQAENFKTFTDWCLNRGNLTTDAKHTVEVLLEKAETQNCQQANQKLTSLSKLSLENNQISDIQPLQSLSQLTELSLYGNPIPNKTCPLPESVCHWEKPKTSSP